MKRRIAKLTDSERQVLDLLWDKNEPLTSSEIVEFCENRIWKASYIHILINSLLKKEMIKISGFKKTTKNYARTFEPSLTREEYSILQVKQQQKTTSRTISKLFTALLDDEPDSELLEELSRMLDEQRKKLDEKSKKEEEQR